jgi:nitroreductase
MTDLYAGKKSPELIDYLLHRRSVKNLTAPGPDAGQVETILRAGSRVPDHGKLFPWYFIVLEGDARKQAGEILKAAWLKREPDAAPAKLELEAERFLRAPVVIGVVSKIRESKNQAWEQILSAGAVCMNISLAANTLGFASNWLTEWYSYDADVLKGFGIGENENVAGFIYIGTPAAAPEERDRPDLAQIVTHWRPGAALNKGGNYGHIGKGWPDNGFKISGR